MTREEAHTYWEEMHERMQSDYKLLAYMLLSVCEYAAMYESHRPGVYRELFLKLDYLHKLSLSGSLTPEQQIEFDEAVKRGHRHLWPVAGDLYVLKRELCKDDWFSEEAYYWEDGALGIPTYLYSIYWNYYAYWERLEAESQRDDAGPEPSIEFYLKGTEEEKAMTRQIVEEIKEADIKKAERLRRIEALRNLKKIRTIPYKDALNIFGGNEKIGSETYYNSGNPYNENSKGFEKLNELIAKYKARY